MKFVAALSTFMGFLLFASGLSAQTLTCSSAVSVDGAVIEVASTNGDDTANLQCALEQATSLGYRQVLLTSSTYEIGAIEVTGFVGDLSGISRAATTVVVSDSSLTCSPDTIGVALQFNVGSPSVRSMTISTDSPCGDGGDATLVAFYSNPANCADRTVFGNVDRVALTGSGVTGSDFMSGVTMKAHPSCNQVSEKALGTLRLNRSTLSQLEFGVNSSIGGGGQVDINFNEFSKVALPIAIIDAFQNTTILGNTLNYNDAEGYALGSGLGTTGVFVSNTADSPTNNVTTLRSNTFADGGVTTAGVAVLTGQIEKAIDHSMTFTGNTFAGDAATTGGVGIAAVDTSGGLVSGNFFRQFAVNWIELLSGNPAQGAAGVPVEGWAIVGNTFAGSTATTDINLGSGTAGNIVGKSQNLPTVIDATGSNDVLESAARSAVDSGLVPKRGQVVDLRSRVHSLLELFR